MNHHKVFIKCQAKNTNRNTTILKTLPFNSIHMYVSQYTETIQVTVTVKIVLFAVGTNIASEVDVELYMYRAGIALRYTVHARTRTRGGISSVYDHTILIPSAVTHELTFVSVEVSDVTKR